MPRIEKNITLEDVVKSDQPTIYYGALTCWWTHDPAHLGRLPSGLPCDPQGKPLLQSTKSVFLDRVAHSVPHYGRHGVEALMAAHNLNCLTDDGHPTCFDNWDIYNRMIDNG